MVLPRVECRLWKATTHAYFWLLTSDNLTTAAAISRDNNVLFVRLGDIAFKLRPRMTLTLLREIVDPRQHFFQRMPLS